MTATDAGRSTSTARSTRRLALALALALALGANQLLSWATSFYLPAVIAHAAADDLDASLAAVLGSFAWALLVTCICAPRVGRWISRRGGKGVLAASTTVLALGLRLLAAAPTLAAWYAAWTVLGAGMALGLDDGLLASQAVAVAMPIGPGQVTERLLEWLLAGQLGPASYAATLGWLAVPVLLAQAAAPTMSAPLIAALPVVKALLLACGLARLAAVLLLPLRPAAARL